MGVLGVGLGPLIALPCRTGGGDAELYCEPPRMTLSARDDLNAPQTGDGKQEVKVENPPSLGLM